jgi:hypothetical protein
VKLALIGVDEADGQRMVVVTKIRWDRTDYGNSMSTLEQPGNERTHVSFGASTRCNDVDDVHEVAMYRI